MGYFERTERTVAKLAGGLAILGGAGLIFATLTTCASILLKVARGAMDALFGASVVAETVPWLRPILGEEEIVSYSVGFALFAALPWVTLQKGHIKVDLLESLFRDRLNRFLDFLGDLSIAVLAYLIMTRQWYLIFSKARGRQPSMGELLLEGDFSAALGRLRTRQESQILEIPLWPTYVVAEICVVIFFLVACFCVLRSGRALFAANQAGVSERV